ncbi:hypothetical protein BDN70DRAFT_877069 [Pholiota conissans]|uniref:Uncharacterized protein n=1 Tax=Pholiota conissans TaxID=109636 RepID=A0A9P5Z621_9AGAR|nr:hypothetical protein BDN70DRAFT_877069 [Pholiota conissans]
MFRLSPSFVDVYLQFWECSRSQARGLRNRSTKIRSPFILDNLVAVGAKQSCNEPSFVHVCTSWNNTYLDALMVVILGAVLIFLEDVAWILRLLLSDS